MDKSPPDVAQKLVVVQAATTSFTTTLSDLTHLRELSFPDASELTDVNLLHERLAVAQATYNTQAREIELLRTRSASILAQWFRQIVLQDGQEWSDWESRLAKAEQLLRRREKSDFRRQLQREL